MLSFISSSEPHVEPRAATWPVAIRRFIVHVILVGLTVCVIGELWFRLPWTTKLIVYEFDEERGSRFAAPQARGIGLGNFSHVSPPIGINAEGFRNREIDWNAPTILAVGSSELAGTGVEDHEVWSAIASDRLSETAGRRITVINAGSASYGPFHHAVTVRRFLEQHPRPRGIVVRASITDRLFTKPGAEALEAARRQKRISTAIKRVSEFLPFLVNKALAQKLAIETTFTPSSELQRIAVQHEPPAVADAMWQEHAKWWREIADMAATSGVPVLFYVDSADGAPSGTRLAEHFKMEFKGRRDVMVAAYDGTVTGLAHEPDEVRRRRYLEEFTLGYDGHANARAHALIAQSLMPYLERFVVGTERAGRADGAQ
jgi:hypothetical protein